jgi:hypothetical protein
VGFWNKNELKTTLENREFGHNARTGRSTTSWFSFAGGFLIENQPAKSASHVLF